MSFHIECCSSVGVGEVQVFSISRHRRPITLRETSEPLELAKATAVLARISAWTEPRPPLTERLMNASRTMSRSSLTLPILLQILAWIDGYMSSSSMVMLMSLSRIMATFCRLFSSLWRQKRVRLESQGVMYSRQRCFSWMVEERKPRIERDGRNSNII